MARKSYKLNTQTVTDVTPRIVMPAPVKVSALRKTALRVVSFLEKAVIGAAISAVLVIAALTSATHFHPETQQQWTSK